MAGKEDSTIRAEREQEVTAVRHLSRKTQQNYLVRPKSLIAALADPQPLSAEAIKSLAEIEYASPVTSLYLRMDAEDTAPRGARLWSDYSTRSRPALANGSAIPSRRSRKPRRKRWTMISRRSRSCSKSIFPRQVPERSSSSSAASN